MSDTNNESDNNNGNGNSQNDHRFPARLHYMLHDMEEDGLESIISFCPGGIGVIVHDKDRLVKEVLPLWFRQTKAESFLRQLKNYGFQKSYHGPTKGGYVHPLFLRGRPELCDRIRLIPPPAKDNDGAAVDNASTSGMINIDTSSNHNMNENNIPEAIAVPAPPPVLIPPMVLPNMAASDGMTLAPVNEERMSMIPYNASMTETGMMPSPQTIFSVPPTASNMNALSMPYLSCDEIIGAASSTRHIHYMMPGHQLDIHRAAAVAASQRFYSSEGPLGLVPHQGVSSYFDRVASLDNSHRHQYHQPSPWLMARQQQLHQEYIMEQMKLNLVMRGNNHAGYSSRSGWYYN